MQRTNVVVLIALSLGTPSAFADAVKMWKWIDDEGKVVYSADPPTAQMANVEEKNIDPNRNVIEMPAPPPSASAPPAPVPATNQVTTRYVVRSMPPTYMPPYPMMNVPYLPPALAMPPSLASRPPAPPSAPRMR